MKKGLFATLVIGLFLCLAGPAFATEPGDNSLAFSIEKAMTAPAHCAFTAEYGILPAILAPVATISMQPAAMPIAAYSCAFQRKQALDERIRWYRQTFYYFSTASISKSNKQCMIRYCICGAC